MGRIYVGYEFSVNAKELGFKKFVKKQYNFVLATNPPMNLDFVLLARDDLFIFEPV